MDKDLYVIVGGIPIKANKMKNEPSSRWNERVAFEVYINTRYYDEPELVSRASKLAKCHVNMMFDGARYSRDVEEHIMKIRCIR
jgi:hypothetical protein